MFRRTGEARYAETRDLVARLLPTGEPANTRDLAAQTIGLCLVDRARLAPAIEANVKRLLDLQRADGHWSTKFDPKSQRAEMQTGESLYALALAGLPSDHPAIRKGTVALLKEQEIFGGWFDISDLRAIPDALPRDAVGADRPVEALSRPRHERLGRPPRPAAEDPPVRIDLGDRAGPRTDLGRARARAPRGDRGLAGR